MKWITSERPKIDRIACLWMITKFIDTGPEFLYLIGGMFCASQKTLAPQHFAVVVRGVDTLWLNLAPPA